MAHKSLPSILTHSSSPPAAQAFTNARFLQQCPNSDISHVYLLNPFCYPRTIFLRLNFHNNLFLFPKLIMVPMLPRKRSKLFWLASNPSITHPFLSSQNDLQPTPNPNSLLLKGNVTSPPPKAESSLKNYICIFF